MYIGIAIILVTSILLNIEAFRIELKQNQTDETISDGEADYQPIDDVEGAPVTPTGGKDEYQMIKS